MKSIRKIFASLLALVLLLTACLLFTACEDIKTLELTVSVYDVDSQKTEDKTLKIDLYRHLAPNTVDAIISYVKEGYYNDTFFYIDESNGSQLMLGDLKFNDGDKKIVQNVDAEGKLKNAINGDFEMNNVKGSNLTNIEGSVGLWRDWFVKNDYKTSDDSRNSGRATWYMPTSNLTANYDGWFCVFGQFDLENEDNSETWADIKNLLATETYYEEYTIYYTGEYNAEGSVTNNGLTFNCDTSVNYESVDEKTVFTPEGEQLAGYASHKIKVPMINKGNKKNKTVSAVVKSIVVK